MECAVTFVSFQEEEKRQVKTNYNAHLCRLLLDCGKLAMRMVFDKIYPPEQLCAQLSSPSVYAEVEFLYKKEILNYEQWDKLFPAIPSMVSSESFDVTLLMVLLQKVCGLNPPSTGWNSLPSAEDTSTGADIARVKYYMNQLANLNQASIDLITFSMYWQNIYDTLARLGLASYKTDIEDLRNESMDSDMEEHYQQLMNQWTKMDDEIKGKLEQIEMERKMLVEETMFLKPANGPPEVNVTLPKNEDLPKELVTLDGIQLPIDFLLLTVKECEFLSCLYYMNRGYVKSHCIDFGYVYFGDMGKAKVALIKCHMGSTGPEGSSKVVRDAVKVLRPKALFCVGTCRGLNTDKIKLGDVVVSEKLIIIGPSKVNDDSSGERGVIVPLRNRLAKLILNVKSGWKAPLKVPRELDVKIGYGALLSGPEVVDSNTRRNELIKRFPEGIAIEMEGEGVFAAAQDLDFEWIIIKGVSDYADGKESETNSWRPFASLMAASLTAHILSDSIVFKSWPHYGIGNTTTSF